MITDYQMGLLAGKADYFLGNPKRVKFLSRKSTDFDKGYLQGYNMQKINY